MTTDTRPRTIASSMKAARLIQGARDVYYPGAPHGITATHPDLIDAELLAFLRS